MVLCFSFPLALDFGVLEKRGRSLLSMPAMLLGYIYELRPNSRALDQ